MKDEADRRFLVDWMLLRLGRWLRLLGQDVALPHEKSDERLMSQAKEEGRTIITRDRGLSLAAGRSSIPVRLIRATKIIEQLAEMADLGVLLQLDPQRCTVCNGPLQEMEGSEGEAIRWQCKSCKRIYWVGGHWKKMESILEKARSRRGST